MSWELGQALSSILPSFWDDRRIHHAEDQAGGRKSPRALPRGLDHLDRLVDIESPLDGVGYDGIWDIGKGLASNERDTLGSEIEVVVLHLGRPMPNHLTKIGQVIGIAGRSSMASRSTEFQ